MAYHLTGHKAFKHALHQRLTPVEGGLRYTSQTHKQVVDAVGTVYGLHPGCVYYITGTKDGNGYVVTLSDAARTTMYLEAEEGCKLC